jgi:Fructose-1-6-bisphosphatase, N-terminal domain
MLTSILVIATVMVCVVNMTLVFSFTGSPKQIRTQELITPITWKTATQLVHSSTRPFSRAPTFLQEKSPVNGEEFATPYAVSNIIEKVGQSVSATDVIIPTTTTTVSSKPFVKKKLQTYLRYLEVECWKRSDLRGLEPVLQAVASACKQITRIVQRAQTDDVYGVALDVHGNPLCETNVQGEVQQKLDVLCNTIMLQAFCGSGREIHAVASEEEDEPRCCSDVMVSSSYAMAHIFESYCSLFSDVACTFEFTYS